MYKYNYVDDQDPLERLRNYLGRTYCLISILNDKKAKNVDINKLSKDAHSDLEVIRTLLDDMSIDYSELQKYRNL